MISDRISKISSNKDVFDRAAPYYNNALTASGYKESIKFSSNSESVKRSRARKTIWFNPPFSLNVKTNVAKKFLKIVDKNFPKSHKLHKLFNRNNLKVSYSCVPNVSNIITNHNKNVLSNKPEPESITTTCNCRQKASCPLNGKCLDRSIIYLCNVKATPTDEGKSYIGLTENTFKNRWYQHRNSFKYESKANSTELSKYVWSLKNNGIADPILSWKIIDHAKPYKNGSKKCNLCLTEKYHIITSPLKLLNKRSELVSKCRHSNNYFLNNYKTIAPDPT